MTDQFRQTGRNYTKTNFVELLELLTPEFYKLEDRAVSGLELNPFSDVINTHLNIGNKISSVLPISSIDNTIVQDINNLSGISKFFVKQNNLTRITNSEFEE